MMQLALPISPPAPPPSAPTDSAGDVPSPQDAARDFDAVMARAVERGSERDAPRGEPEDSAADEASPSTVASGQARTSSPGGKATSATASTADTAEAADDTGETSENAAAVLWAQVLLPLALPLSAAKAAQADVATAPIMAQPSGGTKFELAAQAGSPGVIAEPVAADAPESLVTDGPRPSAPTPESPHDRTGPADRKPLVAAAFPQDFDAGPESVRPADRIVLPGPRTAVEAAAHSEAPTQTLPLAAPSSAQAAAKPEVTLRDRLLEDFEQRFERAIGSSMTPRFEGVHSAAPSAPQPAHAPAAATLGHPGNVPAPALYSVAHGTVTAPLTQPAFVEQFAQRVTFFAGQRVQAAEIAVTPADLGPVSVSIEVRGNEATMSFTAAHATTRAAIEDALPRLREMLASNGLQLANTWVGDQPRRSPERAPRAGSSGYAPERNGAAAIAPASDRAAAMRSPRLIDIIV